MKKKALVISAIAAATVLAGGWAVAQSVHQGKGAEGMGRGMMKGMDHRMMKGMGPGMVKGMGHGMKHGGPGLTFADPARIEALKAELAITPGQEGAWANYARTRQRR